MGTAKLCRFRDYSAINGAVQMAACGLRCNTRTSGMDDSPRGRVRDRFHSDDPGGRIRIDVAGWLTKT